MLLTLFMCLPALAQRVGIQGVIVDDGNGTPVVGATVLLDNQGNSTVTNHDGSFRITDAKAGKDNVTVLCYGYADYALPVTITEGKITDLGTIRIKSEGMDEFGDRTDLIIDEAINDGSLQKFVDEAGILAIGDKYEGLLDDSGKVPAADTAA